MADPVTEPAAAPPADPNAPPPVVTAPPPPEAAPAPPVAPTDQVAPVYIPTEEKPDVIPPVPHAWPASSAPLPEGMEDPPKTTPSIQ